MKNLLALIFVTTFMVGCSTTQTPSNELIPTPKDRVFAFQDEVKGKSGVIIFTRDKGIPASGCYYGLWIDSILSARLDIAEQAKFFIPAGEHLLKVGTDPKGRGLCGVDFSLQAQRETMIKEGETRYFRIQTHFDAKLEIHRVD